MSQTRKIRGINLVYDDLKPELSSASTPPILFIHGQPFNRSMWKYQVDVLKDTYRLIIPDLRGYGESEVPNANMVLLDELTLDMAELLDELDVEDVIVAGLSMGGQIALEFYKLFPERVKGLILADTDSRAEDEEGYARRLMLSKKLVDDGMKKFTAERIHHFISAYSMENKPEVVQHLTEMMENTNAKGSSIVQRGRAERKDLTYCLDSIDVPTLIVVGEHDEFTPVSTAEFLHENILDSILAIIEKAGHIPNMEQTDQFNEVLLKFLKEEF